MSDEIQRYINANRDRYTRESIRAQLIAAGHDPTAVDAELERTALPAAAPLKRGTVTAYVWATYLVGAGVILVFTALGLRLLGLGWLLLYGVIGFFVARRLSRISTPDSPLGWVGVILLAPVAFLLIGGGICAATLALVLGTLNL
jgi:hypothetical protein